MVYGIEGSTEVERDKESRFVIVGRVVNMIKSTKKSCFSGVIAAVSRLVKGRNWEMQECGVEGVKGKVFPEFLKYC